MRLSLLTFACGLCAAVLPPTLPPHPRIVMTPTRVTELQKLLAAGNPDFVAGFSMLMDYVDDLITIPALNPRPYEPNKAAAAYPMLNRVLALGAAYLITDNITIGRRGVAELLNLTTDANWGVFTDPHQEGWIWHAYAPLSSGALLLAASIGVDWFYNILSPAELAVVTSNTLTLGLAPFACCFGTDSPPSANSTRFPACLYLDWCGFPTFYNNWNPVLSSMSVLAGVAFAGEAEVPVAWADRYLVSGGVADYPLSLFEFAGDGLYAESVEYAGYVHQFLVPAVQALLHAAPGNASADVVAANPGACLDIAHWAPLASFSHTTGLGWNWADADDASDSTQMLEPAQQYWAARAGSPGAAFFVRHIALAALRRALAIEEALVDDARENLPNFVIFQNESGTLADYAATPRDLVFLSHPTLAVRGGVATGTARGDTWFGIKGIDGQDQRARSDPACQPVDHNHLDGGSFVWDDGGARFAQDLGYENYGVLGYFSIPARYDYYRASSFGQNTLMVDGRNHNICAWANFTSFNSTDGLALGGNGSACGVVQVANAAATGPGGVTAETWAVLDLSPLFNSSAPPAPAPAVRRGFLALDARSSFATVDEFPGALAAANVTWTLHINGTVAVAPGGQSAALMARPGNQTAAVTVNAAATDPACIAAGGFEAAPLVLQPVPGGPGRQQFNTTGITRLTYVIRTAGAPAASACTRLTIVMGPPGGKTSFALAPTAQWPGSGPF